MGTVKEPVPVAGLTENFSLIPRMAPPPLGREIVGVDTWPRAVPAAVPEVPFSPPQPSCLVLLGIIVGHMIRSFAEQDLESLPARNTRCSVLLSFSVEHRSNFVLP
jgi:hypothetical protein